MVGDQVVGESGIDCISATKIVAAVVIADAFIVVSDMTIVAGVTIMSPPPSPSSCPGVVIGAHCFSLGGRHPSSVFSVFFLISFSLSLYVWGVKCWLVVTKCNVLVAWPTKTFSYIFHTPPYPSISSYTSHHYKNLDKPKQDQILIWWFIE